MECCVPIKKDSQKAYSHEILLREAHEFEEAEHKMLRMCFPLSDTHRYKKKQYQQNYTLKCNLDVGAFWPWLPSSVFRFLNCATNAFPIRNLLPKNKFPVQQSKHEGVYLPQRMAMFESLPETRRTCLCHSDARVWQSGFPHGNAHVCGVCQTCLDFLKQHNQCPALCCITQGSGCFFDEQSQ